MGAVLLSAVLLSACLLAASGSATAAESADLSRINRQIPALVQDGETKKAERLAKRYVAETAKIYGEKSAEYATALTWLGWVYRKDQRYDAATPLLAKALAIRQRRLGPDHALVATSLYNLAGLYEDQGRDAKAAKLIARAEAIKTKLAGVGDLETVPRRIVELSRAGKEDAALQLGHRYLTLAKERYGADQPRLVSALIELAFLYESAGRIDEAEALLKQALAIEEKTYGTESLEAAEGLDRLARLYQSQGREKDAEPLLKRVLAIRKAQLERGDELVIETLYALAGLYEAQGLQQNAEDLYAEAAALQKDQPRMRAAFRAEQPSYAVVKAYYATDRKNTGADDPAEIYGGDRGPLVFGEVEVSIPRDHRMGEVETPSIWRLEWCNDPERFVVLLDVDETGKQRFFDAVAKRVESAPGKSAFIFVHGYNVAFVDAARRTAQMAYDLGFAGAPVFYSWPSQARYAAYKVDETNAEWSRHDFQNFLRDFAARSKAEHIYLIAHSMGTRVLTGALKELFLEEPQLRDRFDEIILAAPDIDADTFRRDIAPKILAGKRRATLYASSGDYALMASKSFAGYRRAGDTAGGITIVPGIDTIDASTTSTDFVGHSYYADSESVLGDLRDLILQGKRAESRTRLEPVVTDTGRYWTFDGEDDAPTP
ncbi:alpha/beta fold hydrolase [Methyloligella sp. 2.7D]|uniref:alpha/beta fold hydrolase n=1 Tax=unclassified Methyloligella TaxID=2625955 RepID=UPI00157BE718|nr:alpha/beta fold hydrolase [Methyloligella sp. GL2]QKP78034.1 alpha/beta fold hydrolase [Methyloligella sp. GL2]